MIERRVAQRGFTLIELMIAIVVLGLLLAIGLPSYQQSVVRGYRAQAQADLIAAAQETERVFSTRLSYAGLSSSPPFATNSPRQGTAIYTLGITSNANTFTITATPVADGPAAGDGRIGINQLGQRFWDSNNDGSYGADEYTWED